MKRKILVIALGLLGVFAVAQAQLPGAPPEKPGCSLERPAVNQFLFGHSPQTVFQPSQVPGVPGEIHSSINMVAKGAPGPAQLTGWAVYEWSPPVPDERCPEGTLANSIVRLQWGQVYGDNSMLSASIDPDQVVCFPSSPEGTQYANLTGVIDGGTGRFDGATGTWSANIENSGGGWTGTLTVYCDN